jgi:molybdate transport system substrate-binding protein
MSSRPGMPRPRRTPFAARSAGIAVLGSLALGACGSSSRDTMAPSTTPGSPTATGAPTSGSEPSGTVTVLAAASLTEAFTTVAKDFERAHPGVTVRLSFGSSTTLAQQIAEGASADLFASAGEKAVNLLPAKARAADKVTILATNSLEIATPPGNPGKVTGLKDLANPALAVVLCAATVPCGSAADTVLARARISAHVVSRELDVKATLAKVSLGEADAAIVYVSDVASAGDRVHGVPIPPAENTTLKYPLVTLTASPAAAALAQALGGPEGRAALHDAGFAAP